MISKIEIRDKIDEYKDNFRNTGNKSLLLRIAIYKGFYLAIGGKKGIPLYAEYSKIVQYSKIIFSYKIKLLKCSNSDKAIKFLFKNMRENFKQPEYFLGDKMPYDNETIVKLLTDIILSEYTEDIIINYNSIYSIINEILELL